MLCYVVVLVNTVDSNPVIMLAPLIQGRLFAVGSYCIWNDFSCTYVLRILNYPLRSCAVTDITHFHFVRGRSMYGHA